MLFPGKIVPNERACICGSCDKCSVNLGIGDQVLWELFSGKTLQSKVCVLARARLGAEFGYLDLEIYLPNKKEKPC